MMQSFDTLSRLNKDFIDGSLKSAAAVTKGLQTIAAETSEFSREAVDKGTTAFEKVVGSNSIEKAFEAQADYSRDLFETSIKRATRLGDVYADMAKDAFKPFENLFLQKSR